ncbi:MAG: hypothetical protein WAP03_17140 [Methylorubrum rhodinum]|uniref:hypothetical protein n=1 Tax=Methylorubrum rhodinum TaxID=29428 RepID=UPI003BB0A882
MIRNPFSSPDDALAAFYSEDPGMECMTAAPLHQAGKAVAPLVISELPNRAMPRRRYAIGFLGEKGYREALPILEKIARDSTELDYIRGDALIAISQIDIDFARKVASQLADLTKHLDDIVQAVSRGGSTLSRFSDRSCEW